MILRSIWLISLSLLAGCSTGAAKFAGPDKSAPTWDLNVGKWNGSTNDMIREPTLQPREAVNGRVGF